MAAGREGQTERSRKRKRDTETGEPERAQDGEQEENLALAVTFHSLGHLLSTRELSPGVAHTQG